MCVWGGEGGMYVLITFAFWVGFPYSGSEKAFCGVAGASAAIGLGVDNMSGQGGAAL